MYSNLVFVKRLLFYAKHVICLTKYHCLWTQKLLHYAYAICIVNWNENTYFLPIIFYLTMLMFEYTPRNYNIVTSLADILTSCVDQEQTELQTKSQMDDHVCFSVAFSVEFLATYFAREWLLSSMNAHVHRQSRWSLERLVANKTRFAIWLSSMRSGAWKKDMLDSMNYIHI